MDTVPAAPITERFGRLFAALDSDDDAFVTWADYQRLVERYVHGYGLDPQERRAQAIRVSYQMLWQELLRHSGAEGERLEREEFVAAMRAASEDRSRFNAAEGVAEAVFDLLDTDGDDRISREEFLRYANALGAEAADAEERFAGVDADEDGFISREEFVLSAREYLFGDDTRSPGGFVSGVV
ncbi:MULTISPECIES: EF-hand domain-containing protein [unclassified Nocardiopsis]|uniref:EF-hand domain-containing protein n=1 Tax=unclassified Nocardiopsis TaxID=2649073 RepID=UPI000B218024|nr:EF-hand domain-containing protein [Nocardiopsis sp. TSRI0078]